MKIFVILLSLTLVLLGCGKEGPVDSSSLEARDGLAYLKDRSSSFSGTADSRYENGELKRSITYKNGKKDGKEDGAVRSWGRSNCEAYRI
jgi:antitoxin component YwqK of YwqJK toxin-antitoxin module